MSKNPALILMIVLVVGFSYWLGRHAARRAAPDAAPTAAAPSPAAAHENPVAAMPAAPASAVRKGMSWGVDAEVETPDGIVLLGCHGEPPGDAGSCDAHRGDTACTASLPLLCLKLDDTPAPAGLRTPVVGGAMPDDFHSGWVGGSVATTAPMPGTALKSREIADRACARAFGDEWRLAEFHDGGRDKQALDTSVTDPGGWGFYAAGDPIRTSRFWVAIDDRPANCWD